MKKFIICGADETEDGGGYGCEAALVYAVNIDAAKELYSGDVSSFNKTGLVINEIEDRTEPKVVYLCSYYE